MPRLLCSIMIALVALSVAVYEAEAARCSGCLESKTTTVAAQSSGLRLAPATFTTKASTPTKSSKKKKKKKKTKKPPPPPPVRRSPSPSPKSPPPPPPFNPEVIVLSPKPKTSPPPPSPSPSPSASPSPSPSPTPSPETSPRTTAPQIYTYQLLNQYPHDSTAYTQGLLYDKRCTTVNSTNTCREVFWESTGLYGDSSIREVALTSGEVLQQLDLPEFDFGEGLAKIRESLYQLTWLSGKGYVWSAREPLANGASREFMTPLVDGWGATSNGVQLIVTDSTNIITFLDLASMQVVRQIVVQDEGRPVKWLNELEWIDGVIYANVYQTECIAKIDPDTGAVTGWLDMRGLRNRALAASSADRNQGGLTVDVLNGIAWDAGEKRMFVTGKLWPTIYQIAPVLLPSTPAAVLADVRAACIIDPDRSL